MLIVVYILLIVVTFVAALALVTFSPIRQVRKPARSLLLGLGSSGRGRSIVESSGFIRQSSSLAGAAHYRGTNSGNRRSSNRIVRFSRRNQQKSERRLCSQTWRRSVVWRLGRLRAAHRLGAVLLQFAAVMARLARVTTKNKVQTFTSRLSCFLFR